MSYKLRHFVNRERELAAFEARLQGREKSQVLLFHGPKDYGKTFMLHRLRQVCQEAKTTCALVDLELLNEADAIIDCLGDQIGDDFFDAIERAIEATERDLPTEPSIGETLSSWAASSAPVAGQPASGSQITAQVGDIVDSVVIIGKDITMHNSPSCVSPEMELTYKKKRRIHCLNKALREALERMTARKLVILLFDACDCATKVALKWLRTHLLFPLLEGDIPSPANLAIVLAGDPNCEKGIWLDEIADWGEGVAVYELGDLPPEAVRKYWIEIRGLDESTLDPDFRTLGAPPGLMVAWANFKAGV
jgi:hypothetical protein